MALFLILFTFVMAAALIIAAILIDWSLVPPLQRTLFIFFGIFPLINAIFDALSYALTLTLIGRGLRGTTPAAILYAVFDLACAVVIFAALGATLIAVVAGLNALAGVDLLPLSDILADLSDGTADPEHRWVLLMVFSTLAPTLIHFALTLLSLQSLVPAGLRRRVARHMRGTSAPDTFAATLGFGLVATLPFACVILPVWGLLTWL